MKISYLCLLPAVVEPLLCAEHALRAAEDFNRDTVADYLRARGVEMPSLSESELAELTQRTPTGETELMRAVAAGDMERVAYILMHAPQLVNLQNAYGYTALMQAESAEMVNLLQAFGADVIGEGSRQRACGLGLLNGFYQMAVFLAQGFKEHNIVRHAINSFS